MWKSEKRIWKRNWTTCRTRAAKRGPIPPGSGDRVANKPGVAAGASHENRAATTAEQRGNGTTHSNGGAYFAGFWRLKLLCKKKTGTKTDPTTSSFGTASAVSSR